MKSFSLTFLFVLIVLVQSSCSRNNIHEKTAWKAFFDKHQIDSATFELYDNTHDQVYIYNIPYGSKQQTPASTFKIFNSLVALDINLAPDIEYVIPWDGITRSRASWNKDMDMKQAFKLSCLPYYQELARRIGRDTLQHYLDTVRYGNKIIGDSVDNFWIDGSLKISADEQVGFVKKLYFDKLPFSDRAQRLVRTLMLQEETPTYKLYYKTGTNLTANGYLAHLVGFIEKIEKQKNVETGIEETNYRPYFFATSFETRDRTIPMDSLLAARLDIAKSVFKDLKITE